MSATSRERLARIVRQPGCDLAEAALLCCVELEPETDVQGELLRLDALADGLRTSGFEPATSSGLEPATAQANAAALRDYLAGRIGFTGDAEDYYNPRNALMTRVLDRKRGLPITLSIVYVAIGRRLGLPVFGIGLPGHFVTAIGTAAGSEAVVIDPFYDGRILDADEVAERVRASTDGRVEFEPAMLRPAEPAAVIRRLLNNLTRDFLNRGDARDALWTVELKQRLPTAVPGDHRVRGELLDQLGRLREAAQAYETYLQEAPADADDRDEVERMALRARAKLN